jgi:hypothetical protein
MVGVTKEGCPVGAPICPQPGSSFPVEHSVDGSWIKLDDPSIAAHQDFGVDSREPRDPLGGRDMSTLWIIGAQ